MLTDFQNSFTNGLFGKVVPIVECPYLIHWVYNAFPHNRLYMLTPFVVKLREEKF